MIIAIDFDGTIVEHEFPKIGPLKEGAKEAINQLYDEGHKIIIWTCRTTQNDYPDAEPTIFHVEKFLREKGVKFHTINNNISGISFQPSPKVYANVYIDDRNLGGLPHWDVIYAIVSEGYGHESEYDLTKLVDKEEEQRKRRS